MSFPIAIYTQIHMLMSNTQKIVLRKTKKRKMNFETNDWEASATIKGPLSIMDIILEYITTKQKHSKMEMTNK